MNSPLVRSRGRGPADCRVVHAAFPRVSLPERLPFSDAESAHTLKMPRYDTREMVLAAVNRNGFALQDAVMSLKADHEIVLAAVQQNGHALGYAAMPLKADREIVLAAMQQNGRAIEYAAMSLMADREFMLAAVQQDGGALQHAVEPLKADREIVLAAVQQNGYALGRAATPLKADREIVLAAVKQHGGVLRFTTAELRADVQVVLAAVKSAGRDALEHASSEMRDDSYLQRLAAQAGRPTLLRAFLTYARDLREANIKAQVDLWLTCHNNGELHHWMDSTHTGFKRRKRARLDELGD